MALSTITYDNKVALQVQSEVANINKIRMEDMNEIKSVVNTNAENAGDLEDLMTEAQTSLVDAINEVDELVTGIRAISPLEIQIGYFNAKPLYRKLIIQDINNSGQITFAHGIENLDTIVNVYGSYTRTGGSQFPLTRVSSDGNNMGVETIDSTKLWNTQKQPTKERGKYGNNNNSINYRTMCCHT